MPFFQTDATSLQLLFAPDSVQMNQTSAVPLKCVRVSLHRNGRSARMKALPENHRNTFKNKLKEIKIKTFQSTISPEQKTHLLTPEQQTHKGILQAVHPVDCISYYCTTLIFILTPPRFQDYPSLHGCQGSLSCSLQHPCTLQASVEPETRCYTYSAPTRFSTLNVLMVLNCSDSKLTSVPQFTGGSVRLQTDSCWQKANPDWM